MSNRLNPDFLAFDEDYEQTMETVILPWLDSRRQSTTVSGSGGRPLYAAVYAAENPRATVTLVHGFTENEYKYAELIFSLLHNGFSVVGYDQRGHGRSWRKPGLQRLSDTHVDSFSEYVEDLKAVTETVLASLPRPWFVFSHSMGGAVTALFLEQYPGIFDRAAFCAPMIAPNLSGLPVAAASALCRSARMFSRGSRRVSFIPPYSGPEDFKTSAATDPVRFAWYDRIKAAHPEFQNNAPTYNWVLEALRVTRQILAPGAPEKITIPVFLSSAEEDTSVVSAEHQKFIDRVPNGRLITVPGSRHEIYRSPDKVLHPWWHQVLAFFSV